MPLSFPALIAEKLRTEKFGLLDIGCSGGIDPMWRAFEPRLRALGIDASETECRRLAGLERNPDVSYVAAFVGSSADKPIDLSAGPAAPLIMKIRDRMSFMRTREIREGRLKNASTAEQFRHNAWELTGLADPGKPVVVPDLLDQRGWSDLDYLKIDIDGADFEILQTFDGRFDTLGVIAVQLEVNFVGTEQPHEHTFHNTDRFLRRAGFDLFRLDVRNCSTRALPARYIWPTPAETVSGRPFQGEAYYARDVAAPGLSPAKRAKLAAIFSLWAVPDLAAELLVAHRPALAPLFDIDKGLDLLAAQQQPDRAKKLDYKAYLASFEADDRWFYRPEGNIGLGERLAAAWQAFRRPRR
jgi:hypothetical protein